MGFVVFRGRKISSLNCARSEAVEQFDLSSVESEERTDLRQQEVLAAWRIHPILLHASEQRRSPRGLRFAIVLRTKELSKIGGSSMKRNKTRN